MENPLQDSFRRDLASWLRHLNLLEYEEVATRGVVFFARDFNAEEFSFVTDVGQSTFSPGLIFVPVGLSGKTLNFCWVGPKDIIYN